jgi:hypothetical protein
MSPVRSSAASGRRNARVANLSTKACAQSRSACPAVQVTKALPATVKFFAASSAILYAASESCAANESCTGS